MLGTADNKLMDLTRELEKIILALCVACAFVNDKIGDLENSFPGRGTQTVQGPGREERAN